jgi:hypothetical protein
MALSMIGAEAGQHNLDLLASAPAPEGPGVFTGALTAPFRGFTRAIDIAAEYAAEHLSPIAEQTADYWAGPDAAEWVKGQTALTKRIVNDNIRFNPQENGMVAQVLYQAGEIIPSAIVGGLVAGPAGAAATGGAVAGRERFLELRQQGVDEGTATWAGYTSGAIMAGSIALAPYYGIRTLTQVASGVGINVAAGGADRFATHTILDNTGYENVAEHYQVLDGSAIMADAIMGAAFPLAARAWNGRGWRPADKESTPSVEQTDSAFTATEQQQLGTGMPMVPDSLEGVSRMQDMQARVAEQMVAENRSINELVVGDIPPGLVNEPMLRQMRDVAALTDEVRHTDPEMSVAMRAAEDMLKNGVKDLTMADVRQAARAAEIEKGAEAQIAEDYDRFLRGSVDQVAQANPNLRVEVDGESMTVKDAVARLEEITTRSVDDAKLVNIAKACALMYGD